MGKQAAPADLFMNFMTADLDVVGNPPDTLRSVEIPTGLSVRGGFIMLIHMVAFKLMGILDTGDRMQVALSTREGVLVPPQLDDDGCIARICRVSQSTAVGTVDAIEEGELVNRFLPPIPLAAPRLFLSEIHGPDGSLVQSTPADERQVRVRIGFTTAPLTSAVYTEIAETWGW